MRRKKLKLELASVQDGIVIDGLGHGYIYVHAEWVNGYLQRSADGCFYPYCLAPFIVAEMPIVDNKGRHMLIVTEIPDAIISQGPSAASD